MDKVKCMATKAILKKNAKVGYMYREAKAIFHWK